MTTEKGIGKKISALRHRYGLGLTTAARAACVSEMDLCMAEEGISGSDSSDLEGYAHAWNTWDLITGRVLSAIEDLSREQQARLLSDLLVNICEGEQ